MNLKNIIEKVHGQVWDQVEDQVWPIVRIYNQVWDRVRPQIRNRVCNQVQDKFFS